MCIYLLPGGLASGELMGEAWACEVVIQRCIHVYLLPGGLASSELMGEAWAWKVDSRFVIWQASIKDCLMGEAGITVFRLYSPMHLFKFPSSCRCVLGGSLATSEQLGRSGAQAPGGSTTHGGVA